MFPKMTHIAMRIRPEELHAAEKFYCELFGMSVSFRETMTEDGWATLPAQDAWSFAAQNDLSIGLVMLYNADFAIDLEVREVPEGAGRYSHTGLQVDQAQLAEMTDRSRRLRCNLTYESDDTLVFDDPYAMRWEFTTLDYSRPDALSAGAREGRWAAEAALA
jgi:catechol 2,3-dioxygenase-like lactoylglutathione lyase family enzyme